MSSVASMFSSGYQPGYTSNTQTAAGKPTNPEWKNGVVNYLATAWVNGWRGLPGGWNESVHGSPDPSDTNGVASARTLMAFSRYADTYQPGMSEALDSSMPWVAPSQSDYVETPEQTANRVAQDNWQAVFDYNAGRDAVADQRYEAEKADAAARYAAELKIEKQRMAMSAASAASSRAIAAQRAKAEEAYQNAKLALDRTALEMQGKQFDQDLAFRMYQENADQAFRQSTLGLQERAQTLNEQTATVDMATKLAQTRMERAGRIAQLGADYGDAVQREIFLRTGGEPTGNAVDYFTGQQGQQGVTLSQIMEQNAPAMGGAGLTPQPTQPPQMATGGWTDAPAFISGDPKPGQESKPNPELIEVRIGADGNIESRVTPMQLSDILRMRNAKDVEPTEGVPMYPEGTSELPYRTVVGGVTKEPGLADVLQPTPDPATGIPGSHGAQGDDLGSISIGGQTYKYVIPPGMGANYNSKVPQAADGTLLWNYKQPIVEPDPTANMPTYEEWVAATTPNTVAQRQTGARANAASLAADRAKLAAGQQVAPAPAPVAPTPVTPRPVTSRPPENGRVTTPSGPQTTTTPGGTDVTLPGGQVVPLPPPGGPATNPVGSGSGLPAGSSTTPASDNAQVTQLNTLIQSLIDAINGPANVDVVQYDNPVYQQLADLLQQPDLASTLGSSPVSVPTLGLTGEDALPAPNDLSYGQLLDLYNNAPDSFATLAALFKAGNQSLPNIMAATRTRAPIGSAVQPTLISTY